MNNSYQGYGGGGYNGGGGGGSWGQQQQQQQPMYNTSQFAPPQQGQQQQQQQQQQSGNMNQWQPQQQQGGGFGQQPQQGGGYGQQQQQGGYAGQPQQGGGYGQQQGGMYGQQQQQPGFGFQQAFVSGLANMAIQGAAQNFMQQQQQPGGGGGQTPMMPGIPGIFPNPYGVKPPKEIDDIFTGVLSFMNSLRYYFAVDNRYVLQKMKRILFPFMTKHWKRNVSDYGSCLLQCLCVAETNSCSFHSFYLLSRCLESSDKGQYRSGCKQSDV